MKRAHIENEIRSQLKKEVFDIEYIMSKIDKYEQDNLNEIKNLSSDPEIKRQQLKKVSDFVRHSSYFYHLFDVLEDIGAEFNRANIEEVAIDNYERDTLEDGLKNLLEKATHTAAIFGMRIYHQSDPRGASLYIMDYSTDWKEDNVNYSTHGVAVY